MTDKFLPHIELGQLKQAQSGGDPNAYYDLLCQPLHEELYRRQDFAFFDELNDMQQMLICYDYIQNNVLQGGFIQLIQNGYVNMLLPMPEWLGTIGDKHMAQLLAEALKAYVDHKDILDKETTVEEFAALYNKLPVFHALDNQFQTLHPQTINHILAYATIHIHEFANIAGQ